MFDRLDKKDNNLQRLVDRVGHRRDEHLELRDEIYTTEKEVPWEKSEEQKRRAAEHRRLCDQIFGRKEESQKGVDDTDDEKYNKGENSLERRVE